MKKLLSLKTRTYCSGMCCMHFVLMPAFTNYSVTVAPGWQPLAEHLRLIVAILLLEGRRSFNFEQRSIASMYDLGSLLQLSEIYQSKFCAQSWISGSCAFTLAALKIHYTQTLAECKHSFPDSTLSVWCLQIWSCSERQRAYLRCCYRLILSSVTRGLVTPSWGWWLFKSSTWTGVFTLGANRSGRLFKHWQCTLLNRWWETQGQRV